MKKFISSLCVVFIAVLLLTEAASAAISDEAFWRLCFSGAAAEEVASAIKAGANVNAANGDITALHYAASNDDPSVVEILLKNGANVNARTELGGTPLLFAVQRGRAKIIELLLDYGANAAIPDSEGRTVMEFIRDSDRRFCEATPGPEVLRSNGVDENEWAAAVKRLRSAIESAPAFVPQVKGLWLKCPSFPEDAEVVEFIGGAPWDDNLSQVVYTRSVDGLLTFRISRWPAEGAGLQRPADVGSVVDMYVYNEDIDEDAIEANLKTMKINENASEFAEILSYPCATAEYRTGQGKDARQNYVLFIFADDLRFSVGASVAPDLAEDYAERIMGWFKGLKFVD